jgi:hypothetical protein
MVDLTMRQLFGKPLNKIASTQLVISSLASALLLSACGGGGSDSSTTTASTTVFPLQAGYKASVVAGQSNSFSVAGTCPGTATFTASAAVPANFEGVAGFSSVGVLNVSLSACSLNTISNTATNYFDSNYAATGSVSPPVSYAKFLTAPLAVPASVKVGDAGVLSTLTVYTDGTKATVAGQVVLSYVIESDTGATAIVNLISKGYNASNVLLTTQQTRYRIAAAGTLAIVSIDIQASSTSTNHFLLTKI